MKKMDNTGEQLHPNWRALTTVHIPLKRFIKEGTKDAQQDVRESHEKYKISGVRGDEIRDFYEKLITTEQKQQFRNSVVRDQDIFLSKIKQRQECHRKVPFKVKDYFRFSMENNVQELKTINFEGQNLDVCDNYGWSALMMASCGGAYEAVSYLLTLGLDRDIKDKKGRSALDLAYSRGYLKIVDLLRDDRKEKEESMSTEELEEHVPFYCDVCKQNFEETSKSQHYTSTIHQFNIKSNLPLNKLQKFNISSRNKGLQLMVKQGWDKESGLGPSQSGHLYPIRTVMRKKRTGLGIEQESARVTHFEPYDHKAVQRHSLENYKKKSRNRNDIKREKLKEWKRNRRLRNELN